TPPCVSIDLGWTARKWADSAHFFFGSRSVHGVESGSITRARLAKSPRRETDGDRSPSGLGNGARRVSPGVPARGGEIDTSPVPGEGGRRQIGRLRGRIAAIRR